MARTVSEVMNPELYAVDREEPLEVVWVALLGLGITGAPVVDSDGKPIGMVSLRDLMRDEGGLKAGDRMTSPVKTITARAEIEAGARELVQTGMHRLVVTDDNGVAVGMLSALDVIAGLIGEPARHPESFPHLDYETGAVWTDGAKLCTDDIESVPAGGGVIALSLVRPGQSDRLVWVEASAALGGRLLEMCSTPQPGELGKLMQQPELRYRVAVLPDKWARERVATLLSKQTQGKNPEGTISDRAKR